MQPEICRCTQRIRTALKGVSHLLAARRIYPCGKQGCCMHWGVFLFLTASAGRACAAVCNSGAPIHLCATCWFSGWWQWCACTIRVREVFGAAPAASCVCALYQGKPWEVHCGRLLVPLMLRGWCVLCVLWGAAVAVHVHRWPCRCCRLTVFAILLRSVLPSKQSPAGCC